MAGSSPRERGNTEAGEADLLVLADHPRASGEHEIKGLVLDGNLGSSPRERGTLDEGDDGKVLFRIIPARAGNTQHWLLAFHLGTDHPRASGEHFRVYSVASCFVGSSPRERGTHIVRRDPAVLMRIIPARAGNTGTASNS